MKITDLLKKESIELDGKAGSKSEAIDKMVELMAASGKLSDPAAYKAQVFRREEEGTTGIGEGIAIPHGKCDAVKAPGLAAMVLKDGVDYESLDGEPTDLIFLIAAPNTEDNVHLDVLSRLSVLLMDEAFTGKLRSAKSTEEFLRYVDEAEKEKLAGEEGSGQTGNAKEPAHQEAAKSLKLLGVTACPTGIAHTYMAAEALEKKAKELGYSIKVETRGSGGAKNVLTDE